MGRAAVRTSTAVGTLLRSKRNELGLSLRAVSSRLGERGDAIPPSTLARIEQGQLDPGICRLHLLLKLYGIPHHLLGDLLEIEALAGEAPATEDLQELYDRGIEAWRNGDIAGGLACLIAVREQVPANDDVRRLRQKSVLAFAVAARNLAKTRMAKEIVDELLCEPPESDLLVNSLVLAASLWRISGSDTVAEALIRHAERLVEPDNFQAAAWVLHQKAKLLTETGRAAEAERTLLDALEQYRRSDDGYGAARATLLLVGVLEATGRTTEAIALAWKLVDTCDREGHGRVLVNARIELGRLLAAGGRFDEGIPLLETAIRQSTMLGDRNAEFVAHLRLSQAYAACGDAERAKLEREAARYYSQFVDIHVQELDELHALLEDVGGKP